MPSAVEARYSCLRRLGLTEEEAVALERIWDGPALRLIADERTMFLADKGYGALQTLDAIWHGLGGVVAATYMQHGLTPHQAFVLHTSPTASRNMWGPERDIERVHSLLGALVPPDMVTVILLESESPEEAERLVTQYVSTSHDYTEEGDRDDMRMANMIETENYRLGAWCRCPPHDDKPDSKP